MKRLADQTRIHNLITHHGLSPFFSEDLIANSQLHLFDTDEYLYEANDTLDYLYILVDGRIRISYLFENGKSAFLKFYSELKLIGDMEVFTDQIIKCDVEAITPVTCIALPTNLLLQEHRDDPKFLGLLVQSLSNKLYATINNSSYNAIYPLKNRLASYLLSLVEESKESVIHLKVTYKEISQFLGTTYRHLNRTLIELESDGIISLNEKSITIIDSDALKSLGQNEFLSSLK